MFKRTVIGLCVAGAAASTQAASLDKAAEIQACLATAKVPVDERGTMGWMQSSSPFNLRLAYKPASIAVVETIEQIQEAVRCAAKVGLKLTPKCGGHSYGSFGLGGEDGHLVLEMTRMNKVVLDPKTNIATVQGGSRLGHVAAELYAQGKRAISHGTCPGVGVGGHSLHGGYGMSSHYKGLAHDWMIGATVVLANGTVAECSETVNPDLFWAIRGAGSAFGVVAEMRFKTFAVPEQVSYFVVPVPWTKPERALAGFPAMQDYVAKTMPAELTMRLFVTRNFVNFEGLYYGDAASLKAALAPLLNATGALAPQITTAGWLDQLSHYGGGLALNQTYPYVMNETFHSSSLATNALTEDQIKSLVTYWFKTGKATTRDWYMQVDFHGGATSAISALADDATSYSHRDKLFLFNFYDRVDSGKTFPANGLDFIGGWVNEITTGMKPDEWGMYINYPDPTMDQDTAQKLYWGKHLPRLQKLKAVYDPEELFFYPQSVRPAKE